VVESSGIGIPSLPYLAHLCSDEDELKAMLSIIAANLLHPHSVFLGLLRGLLRNRIWGARASSANSEESQENWERVMRVTILYAVISR